MSKSYTKYKYLVLILIYKNKPKIISLYNYEHCNFQYLKGDNKLHSNS